MVLTGIQPSPLAAGAATSMAASGGYQPIMAMSNPANPLVPAQPFPASHNLPHSSQYQTMESFSNCLFEKNDSQQRSAGSFINTISNFTIPGLPSLDNHIHFEAACDDEPEGVSAERQLAANHVILMSNLSTQLSDLTDSTGSKLQGATEKMILQANRMHIIVSSQAEECKEINSVAPTNGRHMQEEDESLTYCLQQGFWASHDESQSNYHAIVGGNSDLLLSTKPSIISDHPATINCREHLPEDTMGNFGCIMMPAAASVCYGHSGTISTSPAYNGFLEFNSKDETDNVYEVYLLDSDDSMKINELPKYNTSEGIVIADKQEGAISRVSQEWGVEDPWINVSGDVNENGESGYCIYGINANSGEATNSHPQAGSSLLRSHSLVTMPSQPMLSEEELLQAPLMRSSSLSDVQVGGHANGIDTIAAAGRGKRRSCFFEFSLADAAEEEDDNYMQALNRASIAPSLRRPKPLTAEKMNLTSINAHDLVMQPGLTSQSASSTTANVRYTSAAMMSMSSQPPSMQRRNCTGGNINISMGIINIASQAYKQLAVNNCTMINKLQASSSSSASSAAAAAANSSCSGTVYSKGRRRHGTATDPQSIAARTRREKFSDRIRMLQSLVPNGERLDTVSMLGQTLEYIRFLQHQVWELYHGPSSTSGSSPRPSSNHHSSSINCDKWKDFIQAHNTASSTTSAITN